MRYPKPTNFKLFKWLYQQGLIDCSGAKFEDMKVPEVLLQSYRDLVHEAQHDPDIRRQLYQTLGQRHLRIPQHASD